MTNSNFVRLSAWLQLVFWGGLFLLIHQAERIFLTAEVTVASPPTAGLLIKTFAAGLGNDLFVAVCAIGISLFLSGLFASPLMLLGSGTIRNRFSQAYSRSLTIGSFLVAVGLLAITTADIAYYGYNHQHLDFVFFEYIDELLQAASQEATSQAAEQTGAELEDAGKWILRIGGFWGLTALFVSVWHLAFTRIVTRHCTALSQPYSTAPLAVLVMIAGGATAGIAPLTYPDKSWWSLESEAYYSLSQNPIVFAQHSLRDAFLSQWTWTPSNLPQAMTEEEGIASARRTIGEGKSFPFSDYPLVSLLPDPRKPYFVRPVNILLIFVEGLDRRYLDRAYPISPLSHTSMPSSSSSQAVRLTPFLDGLKQESLYFSHFFSNGVQTTRGLFSTLCSTLPRQGTAAIKTRYAQDYLCLPSLLGKAGYSTEMVVSLDSDLPGLKPFLQRNGIDHYYGEHDFPAKAQRLGVGLTDGALLDMVEGRLEALQMSHRPFFLATLTSSMHHPFAVPLDHPEVRALQAEPDQYIAALRYFDLKLDRFFSRLRSRGLLDNTMVLILGDHGRHEAEGATDIARQIGHFMSPLFIWLDDSLRLSPSFQPHTVDQIASQVDIAPTILAMNGLTPPLAPFVGRDLSCLFSGVCMNDNRAYLSSVYDDLIGLVDQSGIWTFSFRRGRLTHADLDLGGGEAVAAELDSQAAQQARAMTGLYLTSNFAIERNRVWSWQALAEKLQGRPMTQSRGIVGSNESPQ